MNTSQFMDKQIMDLSNSQRSDNDIIDLMNPPQEDLIGNKEEIVPSYDFQPIRQPIISSQQQQSNLDSSGARVWNSADSKTGATAIASRVRSLSLSLPVCMCMNFVGQGFSSAFIGRR